MLVDAAKHGDVEIPVFCYEPKLGEPVGACRMCLVEVEGIPKLQTACSTPVRDGMVVYTQTDRVKEAQNAVVEFLLVNHPLDCPVCDKGGECPLQDISMGWGPGRSRSVDPKRHFQKPLPLSPLVKIDRERCILCYRCVRFSQEVAEDEQLQLLERGDRTFVGTFDDRPYVAPFHGNIIELCPVGALTSQTYRFRARPVGHRGRGLGLHPLPEPVQRQVHRPRRARRAGAGARQPRGRRRLAVRQGPLRLPDDQLARAHHRADGPRGRQPAPGDLAGGDRGGGEGACAPRRSARRGARRRRNLERGGLPGPAHRARRRWARRTSTAARAAVPAPRRCAALADPALAASMDDIDRAEAVLVLGCRPDARDADPRPADPQGRPPHAASGSGSPPSARRRSTAAPTRSPATRPASGRATSCARPRPRAARRRRRLRGGGRDRARCSAPTPRLVIVFGSRLISRPGGDEAAARPARARRRPAARRARRRRPDRGPRGGQRPRPRARPGCSPAPAPGFAEAAGRPRRRRRSVRRSSPRSFAPRSSPTSTPSATTPTPRAGRRPCRTPSSSSRSRCSRTSPRSTPTSIFPAEIPRREGGHRHPPRRPPAQRLRINVPHPGDVRPGWQALVELAAALDHETGLDSPIEVFEALASEVPFYAGITYDDIGGQGLRWQEHDQPRAQARGRGPPRDAARRRPAQRQRTPPASAGDAAGEGVPAPAPSNGSGIRLGTYRDLWSGDVTEHNPSLKFLTPHQTLELAPADAERLGVEHGQPVSSAATATGSRPASRCASRMRPGAGFLIEGTAENNANLLRGSRGRRGQRRGGGRVTPADRRGRASSRRRGS